MSSNWNPGNFANRPQEEVEDLASKGGQHSHQGGFANMDPSKQVFYISLFLVSVSVLDTANVCHQRNIASKGGQMSGRNQQQEEEFQQQEEEDEDDFQGFADTGERQRFRYGYTSSDLSHPVE